LIEITLEAKEIIGDTTMANEGSKKVTIDVPIEKYALLEEIKNSGEINSIRAGVTEGVDLVILAHKEVLEENIINRVDNLRDTLSKIKSEHNE
jgi:hypothetical protein